MHKIIEDLNWRYATKKFDPSKIINEDDLAIIKESLRLVPTSYGLQALKFLIVDSKDLREQLVSASYGQRQVADASHLIVLCAYKDVSENDIDNFTQNIEVTRSLKSGEMAGFGDFMKKTTSSMESDAKTQWTSKQLYIALGQLLTTCATLRIDSTPMEGFNAAQYDEILGLEVKNLNPVLVCPIGYRHPEDQNQFAKKVRKDQEDLFETL
jgi:nitroreductase